MSTEYRRGIPGIAHVEAATRLGLLWEDDDVGHTKARWRLVIRETEDVLGDYATSNTNYSNWDPGPFVRAPDAHLAYRPIRPDGTPVDWDVLDQEVARVGQQGPASVTPVSAVPTTQPQGFRVDLWRRLVHNLFGDPDYEPAEDSFEYLIRPNGELVDLQWSDGPNAPSRADILARWTVYQELKPLYDLVDGAQGEAAMPRDVEAEWSVCSGSNGASGNWRLSRDGEGLYAQGAWRRWRPSEDYYGVPLRNFAAVLDAVAERRVAERMRGQAQAPTVTSAQPPAPIGTVMVQDADGTVRPARMNDTARVIGLAGIDMPAAVRPAQPEPRRFADVRPDRHGWRWWRVAYYGVPSITAQSNRIEVVGSQHRFIGFTGLCDWIPTAWASRTVIPTDEQGNPVSWESIGQSAGQEVPTGRVEGVAVRLNAVRLNSDGLIILGADTAGLHDALKQPLPRFTADELDDVDHSSTTKLDEVTLRRGKLPTVEQIAKYREVRARRTGGAVADVLRESRIDCEVAQYMLERWASGLDNAAARELIEWVVETTDVGLGLFVCSADARARQWIDHHSPALDTSEKPSLTMQRERQEAGERRQRLAELRQRLVAERAAQPQELAKESDTMSRFDLIEPDPQADPTASIRAWEARQAAAKVLPVAAPAKPAAASRRPAIEVVDAEVDGLSRSEAFVALFGRALNGGC